MTTSLTSDIPPAVAIFEPMAKTGSASEAQLVFIEKESHGMGDILSDIRFKKHLYELNTEEASQIIETLID